MPIECQEPTRVVHRDEEYDSREFAMLRNMQERHFWYRGRHRFLLHAVRRTIAAGPPPASPVRIVDLGGGCGGWVDYLGRFGGFPIDELALADSSEAALNLAAQSLPAGVARHCVDLLDLPWSEHWSMAFLLDVIEHIPDDREVLRQVHRALRPGGVLFVTVPALRWFWTWNDDFARHQRRYHRRELASLATACGFEVLDARYFMFFLSPLLMLSRVASGRRAWMLSDDQRRALAARMHEVPCRPVNGLLSTVFGLETPLGHHLPFPWGTSLLAVFRKPGG
jgi:SAM-dependent methyltransferase